MRTSAACRVHVVTHPASRSLPSANISVKIIDPASYHVFLAEYLNPPLEILIELLIAVGNYVQYTRWVNDTATKLRLAIFLLHHMPARYKPLEEICTMNPSQCLTYIILENIRVLTYADFTDKPESTFQYIPRVIMLAIDYNAKND